MYCNCYNIDKPITNLVYSHFKDGVICSLNMNTYKIKIGEINVLHA